MRGVRGSARVNPTRGTESLWTPTNPFGLSRSPHAPKSTARGALLCCREATGALPLSTPPEGLSPSGLPQIPSAFPGRPTRQKHGARGFVVPGRGGRRLCCLTGGQQMLEKQKKQAQACCSLRLLIVLKNKPEEKGSSNRSYPDFPSWHRRLYRKKDGGIPAICTAAVRFSVQTTWPPERPRPDGSPERGRVCAG